MNPTLHVLLNARDPRLRQQARRAARDPRHAPKDLQRAIALTDAVARRSTRLTKDGAGAATAADTGFTPTYGSVPQARRRVVDG